MQLTDFEILENKLRELSADKVDITNIGGDLIVECYRKASINRFCSVFLMVCDDWRGFNIHYCYETPKDPDKAKEVEKLVDPLACLCRDSRAWHGDWIIENWLAIINELIKVNSFLVDATINPS
jgi:hypothetical protein